MPKSTMEEEAPFKFEEDVPYRAALLSVETKNKSGTSTKTGKEYDFDVWVWKFEVVEGDKQGTWAFGESEDKLTTHPDNKVRQWGETLRGAPYQIGEGIDTDDLLGLECYLTFNNRTYTKANGEMGYVSDIADVFPVDEVTQAADPWSPPSQAEKPPF